MAEVSLRPAWQRHEPEFAAAALDFWQRLDAMPPEIARERVPQLCAVAHCDGKFVGVSTIALDRLPQLGCRFGFFRCLVDPEYRQQGLARNLTVFSRNLLAEWSKGHPEEQILGMAAIVESPKLDELGRQPVWPASGLTLMGYSENHLPIRIAWFDHAVLAPRRDAGTKIFERDSSADMFTVWQKNDQAVIAQATELWNRLGILPAHTSAAERAKQLCAAGYIDGDLCGVSTIALSHYRPLKARFGFFRCLVGAAHRRRGLATSLVIHSYKVLAEWSKQNPQEKVLGMVAVVENPKLGQLGQLPVWSTPEIKNGLALIGHTPSGRQVRLSWFEHARLD